MQSLNAKKLDFSIGSGDLTILKETTDVIKGKIGSGYFKVKVRSNANPVIIASVGSGDIDSDFPIYTSRADMPPDFTKLIDLKIGSGDAEISAI